MKNQSLKSQVSKKDSTSPEVVRKSFRVPAEDEQVAKLTIDNKQYLLLDVCLDGVGITVENSTTFTIGQTLKKCELTVFDSTTKGLTGRIVHVSLNLGKDWRCGIHWIDVNESAANQLSKGFIKMKEKLLKDD